MSVCTVVLLASAQQHVGLDFAQSATLKPHTISNGPTAVKPFSSWLATLSWQLYHFSHYKYNVVHIYIFVEFLKAQPKLRWCLLCCTFQKLFAFGILHVDLTAAAAQPNNI